MGGRHLLLIINLTTIIVTMVVVTTIIVVLFTTTIIIVNTTIIVIICIILLSSSPPLFSFTAVNEFTEVQEKTLKIQFNRMSPFWGLPLYSVILIYWILNKSDFLYFQLLSLARFWNSSQALDSQ